MKKLVIFISTLLLVGAKGLLLNLNHTHGTSIEDRLDSIEKQLNDEKRQRYIMQLEYDQEKEKIAQLEHQHETLNETDQELLQHYNAAPKRFQDISTQIRDALLSIATLDTKHNHDNQDLVDALKAVQTRVTNLILNQSVIANIQRHLQEKEKALTSMIDTIKHNQSLDREELTRLKASLTSLANSQRTLQSTVNANVNKQDNLQSQITNINDAVLFLATPRYSPGNWNFWNNNPVATQSTIKFEVEKINIGGGYDSNTGVFTCPSDGYYVFHWSVTSTDINKRCSSAIMKNGIEEIGNEVGGNQATFHMNRNDRAWIKATSNCSLVYNHSSFSGFKLI